MEKINIAELLENCPKGMELDCTMYDNLYFDGIDKDCAYPIGCYTIYDDIRTSVNFTEYGEFQKLGTAKCVIFPKGKTTWEGFVPPRVFNDGDIVAYNPKVGETTIYIYRLHETMNTSYYVALSSILKRLLIATTPNSALNGYNETVRLATEEEKERLFQALKDNRYKWNSETKTLEKLVKPKFKVGDMIVEKNGITKPFTISQVESEYYYINNKDSVGIIRVDGQDKYELVPNKFDINTLKPFDSRVLVRDSNYDEWRVSFWGCLRDSEYGYKYDTVRGVYRQCIPYEGNEHLLGKKDDCKDFYKTW